jgi:hypothetical protein
VCGHTKSAGLRRSRRKPFFSPARQGYDPRFAVAGYTMNNRARTKPGEAVCVLQLKLFSHNKIMPDF